MKCKKYIFIILTIVFFSSCTKDFLDVKNTQQLYRESYVKGLSSMEDYLRGVYFRLSHYVESGEMETTYPELAADNLRPLSATSSSGTAAHYNWKQNAVGGYSMNNFWLYAYMTIRMCNFIIEDVDQYRNENPGKADDLKGQALGIRAYIYFKFVNIFAQPYTFTADASHGGVPYITSSDITKPYTRQTVAEVYAAIINDLNNAIQVLPAAVADTRYMNRSAAKALLARVYLFKEDYANAKTLALEIANQVPLMTIAGGYPNDVFKFRSPANTETLFQLSPYPYSGSLGLYVSSLFGNYIYVATNDVASVLIEKDNDIRKFWVKKLQGTMGNPDTMAIAKFPLNAAPEANPPMVFAQNAYYNAIVRSSEMFLTVAEAAAKTNDENAARNYLNAIRKRADPSIADVTATGQALLDSIYKERRKELCFEGLRMFDLQRWKKGVNRVDVLPGSPATLPYPGDHAISPIPEKEVRLAGILQNPGY